MICAISGEKEIQQKNHTFRQNHFSDIINCRLDYTFVSNKHQWFSNDTDIMPAFKTDHLSDLVTISNYIFKPGIWKSCNSLTNSETFTNNFI